MFEFLSDWATDGMPYCIMTSPVPCDNVLGPFQICGCAEQVHGIGRREEVSGPTPIGGLIPTGNVQVDPLISGHLVRLEKEEEEDLSTADREQVLKYIWPIFQTT